ncbi:MAG: hypothetical protein RRY36_05210 [Bacteroidaceae bacterium]
MIIAREKKPRQNPRKEEAVLQSQMVLWFKNTYPDIADCLFSVSNEGIAAASKIAMGMTPGVSDLLYYDRIRGGLYGFEIKFKGKTHSLTHLVRQANWMLKVLGPGRGRFIDSLEDFKIAISGGKAGILAEDALQIFNKNKSKSIRWDFKI